MRPVSGPERLDQIETIVHLIIINRLLLLFNAQLHEQTTESTFGGGLNE